MLCSATVLDRAGMLSELHKSRLCDDFSRIWQQKRTLRLNYRTLNVSLNVTWHEDSLGGVVSLILLIGNLLCVQEPNGQPLSFSCKMFLLTHLESHF